MNPSPAPTNSLEPPALLPEPAPDWAAQTEPWPQPVHGHQLLHQLAQLVRRFVILPQWAPEALALWILHTYAFHLRDVTAYLGVESPEKRCGKTSLLAVLSELVNRPVVAANISPSAFFRVIQETRPTLLIDEADTFLQGNDELRGILNSGYTRKTAFVLRVAARSRTQPAAAPPEDTHAPDDGRPPQGLPMVAVRKDRTSLSPFSTWCPKVMACIGKLPDTLADRCILIRMHRKTAAEPCERLRNLQPQNLKAQCARFVLDLAPAIAGARPEIPPELNDRAADIWEPLLVLADLAGGDWPELARQAAKTLSAAAQEANPGSALLLDLLIAFANLDAPRAFSRTLAGRLQQMPADRPWRDLCKGAKPTEQWLAQRLRPYGIRPRSLWIGGIQAKGYERADFQETFRRYIPHSEIVAFLAEQRQQPPQPTQDSSAPSAR